MKKVLLIFMTLFLTTLAAASTVSFNFRAESGLWAESTTTGGSRRKTSKRASHSVWENPAWMASALIAMPCWRSFHFWLSHQSAD